MSMPHLYLRCELCDQEWTLGSLVGRSSYQLRDGSLAQLHKTLSWCNSCGCYSPVEKMDNKESLHAKLGSLFLDASEAEKSIHPLILFIFKMFGKKASERLRDIQREVSENQASLKMLSSRKSPPKCLNCGSTDISHKSAFDPPEYHPNCGGEVTRHENDNLRIIYRLQHKIYDLEGHFLHLRES